MSRLLRAANNLLLALLIATSATAAAAQEGDASGLLPALLSATVNGQSSEEPILFLTGPGGRLYASASAFARWRMRLPAGTPVRFENELFYPLGSNDAIRVVYSEQEQSVTIDAQAGQFAVQRANIASFETMDMTPSSTGVYLDYDLMADHVRGKTSVSGAVHVGISTRHGVGQASFVGQAGSGGTRLTRLETSWTIDRPRNATTLRLGDSISFAGAGASPVRFGGIQYHRNYSVQPGFVTMPLPSGTGSAAIPSVVDIYVNNALQSSREVAPGPFELSNIPVQTGGGTVQIVVRDLLGRETVSDQAYYASTLLLRKGLHDFSYEAGFVREDFGRRSNRYGEFMAATTHRYGLSDRVTGEAHVQASRNRQMASVAFTALAFDLGQVGGSMAVSRTERGMGYRGSVSFERRTRGLSFGVRGEYASAAFGFIGAPDEWRPPRYTLQAFADLPVWRGSVGLNLLHRSLRGEPSESVAGLSGSFQLMPGAAIQLYAQRVVAGRRNTILGAHLSFALGGRRSASAGVEHSSSGASLHAEYQNSPPVGTGGGYRLSASVGATERFEGAYVHNLPMATLGAQLGYSGGAAGVRLTAAGSIGYMDQRIFASRSLGESFATVRVDGFPGVRVYADDTLVGVTGRDGALIVPGLRPFQLN